MEYGCIGRKLGHSFSGTIHAYLNDYKYELFEIEAEELGEFMRKRDFKAINVTIPYKEAVLPYLYEIDGAARTIGAVNTVVNKDGRLYGYNTDFYGMSELIRRAGIEIFGKKVAILGSGGTSKTAFAVTKSLGAGEIIKISRSGELNYDALYKLHSDTEIIINTTPVGMYPDIYSSAVDVSKFKNLCGVIDAVYNPLRSELVMSAKELGIPAEGGLYMLVAQAVRASEIFTGAKYESDTCERIYKKMLAEKENIVLIGMPASGKSTVGKILSERYGMDFLDTDLLIEEKIGMSISEYFSRFGEEEFRKRESEAIEEATALTSCVIATGGGAVLKKRNIENLKKNGKVFFIDRPLGALLPTKDRPLALDAEALKKRYEERYEIYCSLADVRIEADCDAEKVAERIAENR